MAKDAVSRKPKGYARNEGSKETENRDYHMYDSAGKSTSRSGQVKSCCYQHQGLYEPERDAVWNTETEKGLGRERRHECGKNKVTDANATSLEAELYKSFKLCFIAGVSLYIIKWQHSERQGKL